MNERIGFSRDHHEFFAHGMNVGSDLVESIDAPLSVILQVTRRCNLACLFCSESDQFDDPSYSSLLELIGRLNGTRRVYLSGGEPLIRRDIFQLVEAYSESFEIVGMPTNCTSLTRDICSKLKGKIAYINAGLDGPRTINDSVRGAYDDILRGLLTLRDSGIEVSLSTVILKQTLPYLKYVLQIADVVEAKKVKMVAPILRGRARALRTDDFVAKQSVSRAFAEIASLKKALGWSPRIKFTFWDKATEGYALLVYPKM